MRLAPRNFRRQPLYKQLHISKINKTPQRTESKFAKKQACSGDYGVFAGGIIIPFLKHPGI
jgi:hypothetical protein